MRLELGYLDVRVLNVVVGSVASNFHGNQSYQLPPSSPFQSKILDENEQAKRRGLSQSPERTLSE
jgi:hypothetical protein